MEYVYIEYKGVSYVFMNKNNENLCYGKYWFIIKNAHIPDIEQLADVWMGKQNGLIYPPHIEALLSNLNTS
jgi:hypothetical protein